MNFIQLHSIIRFIHRSTPPYLHRGRFVGTVSMTQLTDLDSISSLLSVIRVQGERVVQNSDDAARKKLIEAAERLIVAARTPGENLYLLCSQPFFNGAVGAAYALGCFDAVEDSNTPTSASHISKKTGAEKLIIVRIMRVLTSSHIFTETSPEHYMHNHLSRIMSMPANRAHFYVQNRILGPAGASLGAFLESHGPFSPTSHDDAPFQFALNTKLDFWGYLQEDHAQAKIFNESMRSDIVGASGVPPYPFTELDCSGDEVFLVDVGGGKGQVLKTILTAFPDIKGQMVLQDLPAVISDAKESGALPATITTMPYDFFTPQPLKGAKAYYLRRILHDWGDKASKDILRNIIPAMDDHSKILINELVLPDHGCEKRMAMNDMVMMSFGGMERSEAQWHQLLNDVGLRISKIWRKEGENLAVIEAVSSRKEI